MRTRAAIATDGIGAELGRRKGEVDGALESLVPPGDAWPSTLHRAIRHSLFAGGKRLRPILALAAAEAVGGEAGPVLFPACGLEMIHTYSLIHDDLPALDNDELRRGVPTCHVVFGEAIAILAGDALLTHGLGVMAQYPAEEIYEAAKLKTLNAVVDAIGTTGMIGGQVADLEAPGAGASSEELVGRARRHPLVRDRGGPRPPRPVRARRRPRVPDQGRPARRRVRRGDARQDARQGRRGRQGDVPGGLGSRAVALEARLLDRRSGRGSARPARGRRSPAGPRAVRRREEVVTLRSRRIPIP
jgi:Polyprenyl synthetase